MLPGDEWDAAAARRTAADIGQRVGATGRATAPARGGVAVGDRVCRALRGGAAGVCRLPVWLCAVDGRPAGALRRADCRSALPDDTRQYRALRRVRREFEDVFGVGAVRFLLAPPVVDQ